MSCEKHGPRPSVTTKTSAFGLSFCLLSPSGHVFHRAWGTMIKSYYTVWQAMIKTYNHIYLDIFSCVSYTCMIIHILNWEVSLDHSQRWDTSNWRNETEFMRINRFIIPNVCHWLSHKPWSLINYHEILFYPKGIFCIAQPPRGQLLQRFRCFVATEDVPYLPEVEHPTTGPVRFLSPVRFLARKAEWSARRNFTSVLFPWSHQATGLTGPARESSMFFISYGARTGPVRDPQGCRRAPLRTRKGIDTTMIGKNPIQNPLTDPARAVHGLFTISKPVRGP